MLAGAGQAEVDGIPGGAGDAAADAFFDFSDGVFGVEELGEWAGALVCPVEVVLDAVSVGLEDLGRGVSSGCGWIRLGLLTPRFSLYGGGLSICIFGFVVVKVC